MQQFFVESIDSLQLSKEQERQCIKVLRMRKGDQVRLVGKDGRAAVAQFSSLDPLELEFVEDYSFSVNKVKITLIASLIRSERMEWMIQKACECGVDRIVLLQADHGVVRGFGERKERKLERLNTIALEASEQAYRQFPVQVIGPISKESIKDYSSELNVFADLGPGPHIINALEENTQSISVIIGPEGGFSESEVDFFNQINFKQVSLGKSVLRAETASIIACSLIHAREEIL